MRNPLLTIIIPSYNCADSIERTLQSIQKQNYTNLQVLIINDGSTDNSVEIIKEFCKNDNRFTLLNKENGGVASARNMSLNEIKGEYITFSDSDDIVLSGAYEYLIACALNSKSDIIVADYLKGGNFKNSLISHNKEIENPTVFISSLLRGEVHGSLCNKLFKSEFFCKYRFIDGVDFMEDMLILINILLERDLKIEVVTGKPIYHYYLNTNSYTNSFSENSLKMGDKVVEILMQILPDRYADDLNYLKANQKLLYLLNCDTTEIQIKYIYPEINAIIKLLNLPTRYKVLLQIENYGYTFFTRFYKKIIKLKLNSQMWA